MPFKRNYLVLTATRFYYCYMSKWLLCDGFEKLTYNLSVQYRPNTEKLKNKVKFSVRGRGEEGKKNKNRSNESKWI